MSMFRQNVSAAIAKARADLGKLEEVIAGHKIKRRQLLVDADDVAAIAQVDTALVANERALLIQQERIEALTAEAHRQSRERQEEARQSAITSSVAPRLGKIEKLAADAERSYLAFTANYSALQSAVKDFNSEFPPSIPRPSHAFYLSISDVERRLATALDRASRHGVRDGISIATGIGESVRHASARYIGDPRSAPLPDAPVDEEFAA